MDSIISHFENCVIVDLFKIQSYTHQNQNSCQVTYTSNPQLEQAFDYVQNTHQNIFLTGKAGTGKTTFLHRVKRESVKRMAIVAPTGVAAINAKGMTIHSLFQIPFGPYLPGLKQAINRQRKFTKKKISLIKSLDLLIIDEISMVRADLLDAIDDVLRRYKDYRKPFGGIQLLMIGDLHQLSPVTKEKDWKLLKAHYKSPYFFDSNAWKSTNPITIQLTHIYRQSDSVFIDLLNKVRDNQLDNLTLQTLNSRYIPNFQAPKEAGYITLTALNRTAQAINEQQLMALAGSKHQFKAKIKGEFREPHFPTEELLEFKIGAQVLFIKNDGQEKRYYNGKIGQITAISEEKIYVKCPEDEKEICVTPAEWKNVKYTLDPVTNVIEEEEKGLFIQYPLKLAWAITIHKSQGLTFEKAIIDAQNAFTHGQVYVALSRCKSFEGIVLRSPINYGSVKTDTLVKDYSAEAEQNPPDADHLLTAKKRYQEDLLKELFNFRSTRLALDEVVEQYLGNPTKLTQAALQQVLDWESAASGLLFATAAKFEPVLSTYFTSTKLPEANTVLIKRLQKAGNYFTLKIKQELLSSLRAIPVFTDNKELKTTVEAALKNLERTLFIKYHCFLEVEKNGFLAQTYLQTKADAGFNFEQVFKANKNKVSLKIPASVKFPELYKALFYWRNAKAAELKRTLADVISTTSMIDLAIKLPTTKKEMLKTKGLGSAKIKTFGKELIKLIDDFCYDNKIFPDVDAPSSHVPLEQENIVMNNYPSGIPKEQDNLVSDSFPAPNSKNQSDVVSGNSPTYIFKQREDVPSATNGSMTTVPMSPTNTTAIDQPEKAYSVEKIRETHPKAYQPWTSEEETELLKLKAAEQSVSYIAGVLGRKRGAIYSRLRKLEDRIVPIVFS